MAFNSFIQIDGIEGQSTDMAHVGWIDVISFKHGATQATASNQNNAAGRGVLEPLTIVHTLDKATPKLLQACLSGQNIASVKLEVCAQISGGKAKLYEIEMKNARIASTEIITVDAPVCTESKMSGVGADASSLRLVEEVSIVCEEIKWTTHTFKTTGELAGDVAAGWNVATDSAV